MSIKATVRLSLHRHASSAAALGLVAVLAACAPSEVEPPPCLAVAVPGIELLVVDATTGRAPPAAGVLAITSAGGTVDTSGALFADADGLRFQLAWWVDTYTVTVEAPGYRSWSRSGVQVEADGDGPCALPRTQRMSARLEPT